MQRGNVLVIGNSGVGKSTLINAVFGEHVAKTGWGIAGTTRELEIYESDTIPFRIIDTMGFEPSSKKRHKAISEVKKWSKNCAKNGNTDNQINMIWFCVDGTSSKLFPETIKYLSKATSIWKTVPVVVVITKSYSVPERAKNIKMVEEAFAQQKRYSDNLRKIIPVVAETYAFDESVYVAPDGVTELIDATNELMPEGLRAAEEDIGAFKLSRKRALAHSVVGAATTAGTVVGAVPIPFSDALLLSPIELLEINSLASIYGIARDDKSKQLINSMIEVGTVSIAAKTAISGLKAIPGINLAASVVNAVIAGAFVAAIGEGTIYAFEQVYLGKKTLDDVDWFKKIIESKLTTSFFEKVKAALEKIGDSTDSKTIGKILAEIFGATSK